MGGWTGSKEGTDIMMVPGLPSRSGQTPGKWLTTVCRLVPTKARKGSRVTGIYVLNKSLPPLPLCFMWLLTVLGLSQDLSGGNRVGS